MPGFVSALFPKSSKRSELNVLGVSERSTLEIKGSRKYSLKAY